MNFETLLSSANISSEDDLMSLYTIRKHLSCRRFHFAVEITTMKQPGQRTIAELLCEQIIHQ